MIDDENDILKEIRATRDAFAEEHGFDIRRMVASLRESAEANGIQTVRLQPRKPVETLAPARRTTGAIMSRSERASQIWAVLAWAAKNRQTITYSQVGNLIGVPTAGLGQLLEPIQSYCLIQKLPPLTILVVQQESGLPGSAFTGASASEFAKAQSEVFKTDWLGHGNPQPDTFENAVLERPSRP